MVEFHRVTLGQLLAAIWRPRIIARRHQLGWTQTTLAEISGYSRSTIAFLEQSRRRSNPQTVRDIREALGL